MTLSVEITHRLGDFTLDAAFEAPAGVTALFGRSGSGKTSVINSVAGLVRPDHGRIVLDDLVLLDSANLRSLPVHRRRLGYVFQEGRLFPHLSVRQNLRYGAWFASRGDGARFDDVVGMLGLGALLDRRPANLSGGEKQRVAIGRALLCSPRLLLMDEPLAALDAERKDEILPYLERLRDRSEIPILYVSHSVAEVARLATTIVMIDKGRVMHAGPAQTLLADPATAPLLGLGEVGAVITGRLVAQEEDGLTRIETPAGPFLLPRVSAAVGTAFRIRIHAQDVMLSRSRPEGISALNILPATVAKMQHGPGSAVMVQLRCGGEFMLAQITARSADALGLEPGTAVFAIVKTVAIAQADIGAGTEARA